MKLSWGLQVVFKGIQGVDNQNNNVEKFAKGFIELGNKLELERNCQMNLTSRGVKLSWGVIFKGVNFNELGSKLELGVFAVFT